MSRRRDRAFAEIVPSGRGGLDGEKEKEGSIAQCGSSPLTKVMGREVGVDRLDRGGGRTPWPVSEKKKEVDEGTRRE